MADTEMKPEKETARRESKERILAAAELVFAEKGFDGARVDEIAKRAGVNKALIYYYFKSKDEILEVLFRKLVDELVNLVDFTELDDFVASPEQLQAHLSTYILYLEQHQSLLRIFLMEALKDRAKQVFTQKFFDYVLKFEQEAARKMGVEIVNSQELLVLEFFTALMPMTGYVVFRDLWCRQFGVSQEELRKNFLSAFYHTHIIYSSKCIMGDRADE